MDRTPASPFPGLDLLAAIEAARRGEGHLFTAGEGVVLDTIAALAANALELYARLTLRQGPVFRVSALRYAMDVPEAVAALVRANLVHTTIPGDRCLGAFDVIALRAACKRLNLTTSGSRSALEDRLRGAAWVTEIVVMPAHAALLGRVEELAGMERSLLVLERLGALKWASYATTSGSGLYPDRRAMRLQERARRGEWENGEALTVAQRGPSPWGKSPFRHAVAAVLADGATADTLATIPGQRSRLALQLAAEGRVAEAVTVCRASDAAAVERVALDRTGRRLARAARLPFPPGPPLMEAPVRRLVLERAAAVAGPRPLWRTPDGPAPVEDAVVAHLAAVGRTAIHAENWFWTSCFALAFRELYWLPLPGRLPTNRRSGPMDIGTAAFYTARREAVDAVLEDVFANGIRVGGWDGEILFGLSHAEMTISMAARIPPKLAAFILGRLSREGWAAARGLPDLLVLDGPPVRVPGAIPAQLDDSVILAEIKGPGDNLRDDQRVWHDGFVTSGNRVELWSVRDCL